ncbi:DUF4352 domain-containing protein [Streptomyces sp. CA-135486]|uniref:DUF4352 domain-containing protein n=1 Tax=Streptomyces sp. CA-135486 TaxID=3240049 RepID=UPI003D89C35E
MNTVARRVVASAASIAVAALLAGCGSDDKPESSSAASTPPKASAKPKTSPAKPSTPAVPEISVGQSGKYVAVDGADDTVKTTMQVTVKGAKYVTPEQVNTTNKPKGQFLVLTLTVKNVGDKPGRFAPYGVIKWQDEQTAAQDATTLETTEEGQDLDTTYNPGQSVTGDVVLDVVRRGGTLSYWDNLFGDGPSFTVKLPK